MAFKIGKFYITRNDPRELLEMNAELANDNLTLKKRNAKAIEKLYCFGEVLPSDFQKEMLEILKNEVKQ